MEKKNFNGVFEGADPVAIDLLEKMLEIDPDKRITAEQTLAHPYLAQVDHIMLWKNGCIGAMLLNMLLISVC